jgi:hypothetical protein
MSADRLTEMSTDPTSSRKEEENKAIVDRWLANFWGKNYNPVIVDELAARHIFFNHSLHTPGVGWPPVAQDIHGRIAGSVSRSLR